MKLTVLAPCVCPKFIPVIVTDAPTAPELGDRLLTLGGGTTVKLTPLLLPPAVFTVTLPVVAPPGTVATIEIALQFAMEVAFAVPKKTVLVPCVGPKPPPLIVTDAPPAPEVGDKVLMAGITVNVTPLLATPATFTTALPVVAVLGTGATIEVELQLVGVAWTLLNVTVLVPWVDPKFLPVMVTDVPT